jgi:hypothetical protein
MKRVKKSLKLGKWNIIAYDLSVKRQSFPLCDNTGGGVVEKRVKGSVNYEDSNGTLVDKASLKRLVNDKPYSKFVKSESIPEANINFVNGHEINLITEKSYWIDCDLLKEYLIKENKKMEFNYILASGYKVYQATITILNGELMMLIGLGNISSEIEKVKAEMIGNEIVESVTDRANLDEVMAIQMGVVK